MLKLYRNYLMAGVVALGLAACGDDLTITDPPPPPPTQNITSFTVSPTSATIAPGTFVQASATLVTAEGVSGSVAWTSSNPAVATVDASGRIDALAEGTTVVTATATAGGQTATAAVGVTVRPIQPAQISIQSVTTGATDIPVNISNVAGQIEINMNFNPGEELVDSIAVFIGSKRAAKQVYVTSPSAGPVSLSVNTANYVKNVAAGTTTVDFQNGATTISAAVYPRGGAATATNTIQIVLNNADAWAGDLTKPSRVANSSGGVSYWGGPGAEGLAEATVYPVIYTPGRSVQSVTFRIGVLGFIGCDNTTMTELPFRATFGYGADGADVDCSGDTGSAYEWNGGSFSPRDNIVVVAALDNASTPFAAPEPLMSNSVVLGSTPDSLRVDWQAPSVNTPSITQSSPKETGWVNASYNFVNFSSFDNGVGLKATRDRKTFYNAPNCGDTEDNVMATGTGADIPECATNTLGGIVNLGGTAPYDVYGTESDRLENAGMSGATQTFGVDKTAPSIRWGNNADPAYAAEVQVLADSVFTTKPLAADVFRAEYIDANPTTNVVSGFTAAGQSHALSTAGHVNNAGACVIGGGVIGAAFVTAPACTMATATPGALRLDGWQGGQSVDGLTNWVDEGYWGYASKVTDKAGNVSTTLFHKAVVSTLPPFATGLTVPATLTSTAFAFGPTFADSTEVVGQSLQVSYPELLSLGADSVRYSRGAIGTVFDDAITSPYLSSISPNTGAPYVRHVEAVNATAFPAANVQAGPIANAKPINVVAWSWNPGGTDGTPAVLPGRSSIIAIPALLVEDGVDFVDFNTGNVTNPVNHFRIISTLANSNQFGSTAPIRAQAISPSNTPNSPFARVDFYRLANDGTSDYWSYLGSVSGSAAIATDQGTYRSWVYNAPATFVNAWDGSTAQTAAVAGDDILAIGVTAAGDGLATHVVMVP